MRCWLVSLLFLSAVPAAAEDQSLAMTSVECYPAKLCSGDLEADRVYLQNKLESAVLAATGGRLKLITPEVVLRILQASGQSAAEARKTCLNASCAVDLGGALGADYIVQGRVLRPGGGDFELTLKVWSIAGSNVIKDGSVRAKTLLRFRGQLKSLAKGVLAPLLKRSRRRRASDVLAFDEGEETGPQVHSGQVTAALGGLMIGGSPTSARVTVTGPNKKTWSMKVGETVDELRPGRYRWQAKAPGYQEASGQVDVPPDGFANVGLKLHKLASLKIGGSPAKARVDITGPDGVAMKPIGLGSTLQGLIPGRYQLRVSKRGYEAQQKTVSLKPGAAEETAITLLRLGSLEISGSPKGALVVVESKAAGFRNEGGLPWKAKGLVSGQYKARIQREGYQTKRFDAEVKAGHVTRLPVKLIKGLDRGSTGTQTANCRAALRCYKGCSGGADDCRARCSKYHHARLRWDKNAEWGVACENPINAPGSSAESTVPGRRNYWRWGGGGVLLVGTALGAVNYYGGTWSSGAALTADVLMVAGLAGLVWGNLP